LLQLFDAVVWTTGSSANQTLGYWARFALRDYLDAGGKLLFSSQGYMSEKGVSGFASGYLRVATYLNNQGAPSATGLAGDPIGDGLSLVLEPPFLDHADTVNPAAGAVAWLQAPAGNVALRYDSGTFRTVFLSAAFDGVAAAGPDPDNRGTVMRRILYWLVPSIAVGGPEIGLPASGLALHPTVPNPFRGSATIRFSVPRAGPVSVAIFDAAGRRVIDLVRGPVPSGSGEIAWEGRDATGHAVANGVYFVRLDVAGETRTRRMVRLR
jgi:hypothetical protein